MTEDYKDQRLDRFLRENAPEVPQPKIGEGERIFRAIQASEPASYFRFFSFLRTPALVFSFLLTVVAIFAFLNRAEISEPKWRTADSPKIKATYTPGEEILVETYSSIDTLALVDEEDLEGHEFIELAAYVASDRLDR